MVKQNARLDYPKKDFRIILKSSANSIEFYGLDELQRKKLAILQAKYGCRHCFHVLPDDVTLDMHRFNWNDMNESFEIDAKNSTLVQLNKLEESIIDYVPNEEYWGSSIRY